MYSHDSTAAVACKNWHPDTTSGTYLPPNTREALYAISPISLVLTCDLTDKMFKNIIKWKFYIYIYSSEVLTC